MRLDIVDEVDALRTVGFPEGSNQVEGISDQIRTTVDLGRVFALIGQEIPVGPQVSFRIVMVGQPLPLHPVIYEQSYRIGREALLNAFRHSQASRVELRLEYTSTKLCMTIRDNGKGISADLLCAGCDGLSWMKGLSERIGATLKLLSRVNAGTEVLLSIPGHIAFAVNPGMRQKLAVA